MNRIDDFGKSLSSCASKTLFALLLATLVYATGAAGNNHACAANSTHKVTDVTGTVTRVELTNVDLQAYARYNADVEALNKDLVPQSELSVHLAGYTNRKVILAKAVPGKTATIRIVPESNYKTDSFSFNMTIPGRYPFKITNSSFIHIKDGKQDPDALNDSTYDRTKLTIDEKPWTLFIPQNADMLHVCWVNNYWYRSKGNNRKPEVRTEYYIFNSDEAFKKAYKLWTGKTISGPIGSSSTDSKKEPANTNANKQNEGRPRSTAQPPKDEDGDTDWGTIGMVGGGLAAAGAIGFGAFKLFGGGGGGTGAAGANPQYPQYPEYPQYPQEPESFVYTDPATGAQTLYERDPNTGEWFDPTTGAITDMSKLEEYTRQRAADRRWMDGQMDNLRNRNTATDRAWNQQDAAMNAEMQKTFDEIDRQGARDKAAIRSGTYGMSEAQRKESQKKWQSLLESQQNAAHRVERIWDAGTKVAEGVQKAADIGMDIAATAAKTVDGGVVSGRIKDAYSMAKNMAGSTADAVARGKNVWAGIGKGFADGLVDIAQNNANGVYKTLSYVGGDAFKGGLNAAWEGEDIAIGAFKGSLKGTMKLGIDKVGDKIRSGITKPEDSLRNAFDHAREIRTVYSKGISQKSVDALQKMNIDKHLANLEKADYQNWANDITNALSSNLLPDAIFGG